MTIRSLGLKSMIGAFLLVMLNGCIPMIIMASKDREHLADINLQREKAGLRPITMEEYRTGVQYPKAQQ
jgi:hypothetical protein